MARRRRSKLTLEMETRDNLERMIKNRQAPMVKVTRAKIILQYSSGQKIAQIARDMSLTRPLVERCIDKALQFGPISGLNDLPRSGRLYRNYR